LPASAFTYLEAPGGGAVARYVQHDIEISDTACDDDSVYMQWHTDGGKVIKVPNTRGCGTTDKYTLPLGNNTKFWFRICVDKSWPTADKCSAYDWDIMS
jgi:hypothetical protein